MSTVQWFVAVVHLVKRSLSMARSGFTK